MAGTACVITAAVITVSPWTLADPACLPACSMLQPKASRPRVRVCNEREVKWRSECVLMLDQINGCRPPRFVSDLCRCVTSLRFLCEQPCCIRAYIRLAQKVGLASSFLSASTFLHQHPTSASPIHLAALSTPYLPSKHGISQDLAQSIPSSFIMAFQALLSTVDCRAGLRIVGPGIRPSFPGQH